MKRQKMDLLNNLFEEKGFGMDPLLKKVVEKYPFRISNHAKKMVLETNSSLWRQIIPSIEEIQETKLQQDPFKEREQSPVTNLIHRYPDRVLLLVTDECAMYCRFCFRKKRVGKGGPVSKDIFKQMLDYIRKHPEIEEVVFSGGDPFTLSNSYLEEMMEEIRKVPHVAILRVHTRMLTANPNRIKTDMIQKLKKYKPLYIITHFNAVDEITPEAVKMINQFVDSGIVLGNQSVLLKGVNDSAESLSQLWRKLIKIRIRPYYLHHPDPVAGTSHFRLSVQEGLKIYNKLQAMSGLCIPRYVIDLPDGMGKRIISDSCVFSEKEEITFSQG